MHLLLISLCVLTSLLQKNPGALAQLKAGDRFHSQLKIEEEFAAYSRAHDLAPEEYEPLMKLSRSCNDRGEELNFKKQSGAKEVFQKGLEYSELLDRKFPNRAEPQYLLAIFHAKLGKLSSSIHDKKIHGHLVEKFAKLSLKLDPDFESALVVLGGFYREVADLNFISRMVFGKVADATFENSEITLKRALELNPNDIFAEWQMAQTLLAMSRKKEVPAHLKKILETPATDPKHPFVKMGAQDLLKKIEGS